MPNKGRETEGGGERKRERETRISNLRDIEKDGHAVGSR